MLRRRQNRRLESARFIQEYSILKASTSFHHRHVRRVELHLLSCLHLMQFPTAPLPWHLHRHRIKGNAAIAAL